MMTNRFDLTGLWHYQPLAWTTVQADGAVVEQTENLPPSGAMDLRINWQLRGTARLRQARTFHPHLHRADLARWRVEPTIPVQRGRMHPVLGATLRCSWLPRSQP